MLEKELREELIEEFVQRMNFYFGMSKVKTWTEVAKKLRRTRAQICELRSGRALSTVTMIHAVAGALEISPVKLFPQGWEAWQHERRLLHHEAGKT